MADPRTIIKTRQRPSFINAEGGMGALVGGVIDAITDIPGLSGLGVVLGSITGVQRMDSERKYGKELGLPTIANKEFFSGAIAGALAAGVGILVMAGMSAMLDYTLLQGAGYATVLAVTTTVSGFIAAGHEMKNRQKIHNLIDAGNEVELDARGCPIVVGHAKTQEHQHGCEHSVQHGSAAIDQQQEQGYHGSVSAEEAQSMESRMGQNSQGERSFAGAEQRRAEEQPSLTQQSI